MLLTKRPVPKHTTKALAYKSLCKPNRASNRVVNAQYNQPQ